VLSAVVAIGGPLGDAVVLTLQRASPPWRAHAQGAASAANSSVDVVIVDDDLSASERRSVLVRFGAPLLVLGSDLGKPFTVSALRAKALSCVRPLLTRDGLVAVDRPLRNAIEILDVAAKRHAGVLITGPTGVGKERLAQRVHEQSGRRGAFVALNCAALHEGLVESALFGHAKGAFTGAVSAVPGALVESDGGTLFLDEVGELDLRIQAKLLRVLEDHCVRPLGKAGERRVDTRVVAATNRDLRDEAAHGRFRSDLFYRLATFIVQVPPLCERPRDLSALVELFIARHDRGRQVRLSAAAREALLAYDWPGNVRELGNVIERVFALALPGALSLDDLQHFAPEVAPAPPLGQRARECIGRVKSGQIKKVEAAAELGVHRTTVWRQMKRLNGK
jgi:transcriptional regulator with PAS, ATPase and Fis domain